MPHSGKCFDERTFNKKIGTRDGVIKIDSGVDDRGESSHKNDAI